MGERQRVSGQSRHPLCVIVSIPLILEWASGCSTPALELSWAEAKRSNQFLIVVGQVQQVHCCGHIPGYIHLEAKDQNGVNLAETNARWGEFHQRQLHSAWFNGLLVMPRQATVSRIDIQFNVEPR